MMEKLRKAGQVMLDAVFPRRCAWCGKVMGFAARCGCGGADALGRLPAQPLPTAQLDGGWHLEAAWAIWPYEEPVSGMLQRLKFEDERELAKPLGEELAKAFDACGLAGRFDVIVPAPSSRKTLRQRGYNQSALLAWQLAVHTGLPCADDALVKVADTEQQMALDRAERMTNLRGAFQARPQKVAGRRILLVDDIMTTGSTLNECAQTLLEAGAISCGALCVAATAPDRKARLQKNSE